MFDPAPIQDHSLGVSGGNDAASYSFVLNYTDEEGLMANTGNDRYGVRLNTDFQLNDKISGSLDLSGSRKSNIIPVNFGGAIFNIIHDTPPTRRTRFSDGTYGTNLFGRSPLADAKLSGTEQEVFWNGTIKGGLNYDVFPKWAEIKMKVSFDYGSMDWKQFRTNPDLIDDWPDDAADWGPSFGENRTNTSRKTKVQALIDYGHNFEDIHDISGVIGYEQIRYNFDEFRAYRDHFYNNQLHQLNLGSTANEGTVGFGNEWSLRSVFGRLKYQILDRYLLEFNARYDGSSRFAEDHRYGFFPSFSVGWRISEESFFNIDWINELKIRGSWGQLGNQSVPLYSYYSSINLGIPYFIGNESGTQSVGGAITDVVNKDLSWETTTEIDIGIDAVFLNDRLSVKGDLYKQHTEDILLRLSVPDMVGRGAPFQNAGIVENKGWELAVNWQDNKREVSYGIGFKLSDNRNKVVDLNQTGPYLQHDDIGIHVVQEGTPINAWYGLEVDGLFSSYEEIDNHPQPAGQVTRLGDIIYVDRNGDGLINDEDQTVIGNPNPHYIYSININVGWKNFDFSALIKGIGEQDKYVSRGFAQGPVWENYTSEWHKDYWTPENQDARMPAYYANENRNYYTSSAWWVLDGSFIKLRNVQLGYTLPQSLVSLVGIQRLRVYVNGKNLWMHSNMGIGLDPEYPWSTGDYYPQTKVVSLGVNINF